MALLVACGTAAGGSDTSGSESDISVAVDAKDAKTQDQATDKSEGTDAQEDTEPDAASAGDADGTAADADAFTGDDTGAGPAVCDPATAKAGECGASCTSPGDCQSNYCVATRNDTVCSKDCAGANPQCPKGWGCKQVASGSDPLFRCVPESPHLGKPCMADIDCLDQVGTALSGAGDKCVSAGDQGAFCGAYCSLASPNCPTGFTCKKGFDVTVVGGKPTAVTQCVADKLNDNCTERFEFELAETICRATNQYGSCSGKRHCTAKELSACEAVDAAAETCNGKDDDCDGLTDEPVAGATCQVTSPNGLWKCPGKPLCASGVESCVGPVPSIETCDGADNDCNGQTDEGCDDDIDGYCDAAMGYEPGIAVCKKGGGDCDDKKPAIHPKAPETCDSLDNDCNGFADAQDAGLPLTDAQYCENQQGVCTGALKPISSCSLGKWLPCTAVDYQKSNGAYATAEICDDKDNDCNGKVDEGCDDDKDGFCDAAMATLGFPLTCPKGGGDCDDSATKSYPGAVEFCDDADQNCNNQVDEGCDKDKDNWCDAAMITVGGPSICINGGGDCNDQSADVRPDAKEACNNLDDDCNTLIDESFPDLTLPCSGGKGACKANGFKICAADGLSAVCSVQPGLPQTEICDNIDNDCDGNLDEGCDDDFDSYCDATMGVIGMPQACLAGAGDCNDDNPDVRPGAKELCNIIDDDCDGKTDSEDGDLLIDDVQFCETQGGVCKGAKKNGSLCLGGIWAKCGVNQYTSWNGLYKATDDCDNADNNCDGSTDEGCDADQDGYCSALKTITGAPKVCTVGGVTHSGDCDDGNPLRYPGADEWCDDVDNDCDNVADELCDKDFDGYCDEAKTVVGKPAACLKGGGDCNDVNGAVGNEINPGAFDVCFDGVDSNCDGTTDESCPWYFTSAGIDTIGPDYSADGWFQCAGYKDVKNSNDVPDTNWGVQCSDPKWTKVRIACGSIPNINNPWLQIRSVDISKNVFRPVLVAGKAIQLIYNVNGFPNDMATQVLQDNFLQVNVSGPSGFALDAGYASWVVSTAYGFNEAQPSLIINHLSSEWDVANCFGQEMTQERALLVYVHQ